MMKMKKPWVQIAIDVKEIGKAKELAEMSIKAGADWIEAGTPLIVYESIKSIGALAEVSKDIPIVADFKAADGVHKYFTEAYRLGAKVAVVLGAMDDGSIHEAVRAGKECGIEVVADMISVKTEKLAERAKELEAIGVNYIMLHFGFDEQKYNKKKHNLDGLEEVVAAINIPVGVSSFSKDDAIEGIRRGASWIIQGEPILSAPDAFEQLSELIKAVKEAR